MTAPVSIDSRCPSLQFSSCHLFPASSFKLIDVAEPVLSLSKFNSLSSLLSVSRTDHLLFCPGKRRTNDGPSSSYGTAAFSTVNGYSPCNLGDKAILSLQVGDPVFSQNHVSCYSHLGGPHRGHNQSPSQYVPQDDDWLYCSSTFPVRVLTALSRERMLEEHLVGLEIEFDNLIWEMKEFEGRLQIAVKERRILESTFEEVEEEIDGAIAKIELLEVKLQDLKAENLQLKETLGKRWSVKDHEHRDNDQNIIADSCGISYGVQSWKSGYKESGILIQNLMMKKDSWESDGKSKAEFLSFLKTESTSGGPMHPFTGGIFLRNYESNEGLERRREAALFQSLFSAVLSLLVGVIIWEAEDPCMPLVVALFTVVGMSLKSVVQFLSTIKNKPASDAVALLSINWFVLGALTYPTLPRLARMLAPWAFCFWTGQ